MIISSSQARQALERLREEIDAFERCRVRLTREQREHVTALRVRRNLLMGLLMVRAIERPKKVVNLALWRWGFAPRATMLRYGLGRRDAATGGAPGATASSPSMAHKPPRHCPDDKASWDRDGDPFAPEAG